MNPLVEKLKVRFPGVVEKSDEFRGDLAINVGREKIVDVCRFLRDDPDLAFDLVVDICGVDMYRPEKRFEVVYHLYSLKNKDYLRLKVGLDEEDPTLDSVTGVWSGANWLEREAFDMFGITFTDHPDLRRMYMPEDYEYYPLRKDFPLMGVPDSIPLPQK